MAARAAGWPGGTRTTSPICGETEKSTTGGAESGANTFDNDLWQRFKDAWLVIDRKQRNRLTKLAESIAGTAHKPHQTTLPKVEPGKERMIPAANVAAELGISIDRLRDWTRKGWITGAEKINGRVHYPPKAVKAAARKHLNLAKRPKDKNQ